MTDILPSGGGKALINVDDTALLLLDHQTGLFQTVKDITVAELRANAIELAKLATLLNIPVITTASEPNGPNGPLMPEIDQHAPHAVYVPRKGEVNAWDNEDFVEGGSRDRQKTLIMAGVWTSVCVMFPALDAKAAGFDVYAVMDASGDPSELASRTTLARFIAGRHRADHDERRAVASFTAPGGGPEARRDRASSTPMATPNYGAVMESYDRQSASVRRTSRRTELRFTWASTCGRRRTLRQQCAEDGVTS